LLIIAETRLLPITCRGRQQSCKQLALDAMQGQAAGGVNGCRCRSCNGSGILPNIWKAFSDHKRGGRLAENCSGDKENERGHSLFSIAQTLTSPSLHWLLASDGRTFHLWSLDGRIWSYGGHDAPRGPRGIRRLVDY
jgi:hypothetical protein